ncbi:hypothetical protein GE21DRAFT_1325541 [Neurospora crassa]|nr:hypothetical protein GE21DRAFT_1325541 [Neurospora crassa]
MWYIDVCLVPHVVFVLINFKAALTPVNASFLSENYYVEVALLQIYLQTCVVQESKTILLICDAASTCSPPGDRHVWFISSMRVPLCNMHLSLAVVVDDGQDARKLESARLLPKGIFSIEVVAVVLDLGDQTFTSTAKYPELRISMSPDSA